MKKILIVVLLVVLLNITFCSFTCFAKNEKEKDEICKIDNVLDCVYLTYENKTFIALRAKPVFTLEDREKIIQEVRRKAKEFCPNNDVIITLDLTLFSKSKNIENILDGKVKGDLKKELFDLYKLYKKDI